MIFNKFLRPIPLICFTAVLLVGGGYYWFARNVYNEGPIDTEYFDTFEDEGEIDEREIQGQKHSSTSPSNIADLPVEDRARDLGTQAREARERIAPFSSAEIMEEFLDAFRVEDNVRINAAEYVLLDRGRKGDTTVVPVIKQTAYVSPASIQDAIVYMLSDIPTEQSLQALFDLMEAANKENLRYAVIDALENIGGQYVMYQQQGSSSMPPQKLSLMLENYLDTVSIFDRPLRRAVKQSIADIEILNRR